MSLFKQACSLPVRHRLQGLTGRHNLRNFATVSSCNHAANYANYLKNDAKVEAPARLSALLDIVSMNGDTLVDPRDRRGLNPFLVPVSRRSIDHELLCYIRWPTQREDMPLQLVHTTKAGVKLVSLSTDHYCHRLAAEMDFYKHPHATDATKAANEHSQLYKTGDYLPLLESKKFPTETAHDLKLVLDRFLLTRVGSFADSYERLAQNFLKSDNDVSALITCERAASVFYSWGHPLHFHTKMLRDLGRHKECTESARACMGLPKWTIGDSKADLDDAIKLAGFTSTKIVGDMHLFRSTDPREKDIAEGHNPIQVKLCSEVSHQYVLLSATS